MGGWAKAITQKLLAVKNIYMSAITNNIRLVNPSEKFQPEINPVRKIKDNLLHYTLVRI